MPNKCTMCTCQDGAGQCHTYNCTITGCVKYSQPSRTECCGTCLMYNENAVQKGNIPFVCVFVCVSLFLCFNHCLASVCLSVPVGNE